jgi:hypothetical protein
MQVFDRSQWVAPSEAPALCQVQGIWVSVPRLLEARTMNRKWIFPIAVVVLLGAAFLAGYVPERQQRSTAETEIARLRDRLVVAEDRVRTGELLGRILTIREVTARQDYGEAQKLSSASFDAIRAEAARTHDAQLRGGLNEALARRDAVTAALAKADPAATEILHTIELRLRQALGYAVPAQSASR